MTKKDLSVYEDKYLVRQSDPCLTSAGRLMKYGGAFGTALALCAAQNYNAQISFLELFGRSMSKIAFPMFVVSGMYGATTCLMDEMRGKDKPFSNALLGGAAAGAVLGTRTHSPGKIASYAVMCGILGLAARMIATNGLIRETPADRYNVLHQEVIISDIGHLSPNAK